MSEQRPAEIETDVVVIGGGSTGEHLADHLTRAGLRTLLVEKELVGGECSYWACMPSKALLAPTTALAAARRVPGAPDDLPDVDPAAVLANRDRFASDWDDGGQEEWLDDNGITLLRGTGRIAGPRRVAVESEGRTTTVGATTAVVIATGGRPITPPIDGIDDIPAWGSREITSAASVPRRLAILGGGAVGCEMAQAWRRLGAEAVTVFEREARLLPTEEPVVDAELAAALRADGITVRTGTDVESLTRRGEAIVARHGDEQTEVDAFVVATGRRPALDGLGLESVGVDPDSMELDEHLRVDAVDGGWLHVVGDAAGRALLTHQGKYQARMVADTIAGGGSTPWADGIGPPRVVFTDPEVAAVGRTAAQAEADGVDVVVATHHVGDTAAGALHGVSDGATTLVADRDRGTVVGATMIGPRASEMIHAATIAVVGEVPVERLRHAVPPFPTMSEVWLSLVEELRTAVGS